MLEQELFNLHKNLSHVAIKYAKTRCTTWGIEVDRRIRQPRRMAGEMARDAGLSAKKEIARVMNIALDRLQHEISTRLLRLKNLHTKFGFLLDVKTLLAKDETDVDALRRSYLDLGQFYDTDVNGHELFTEIGNRKMLLSIRTEVQPITPLDLLNFIISYGDDVFPNLRVSLQFLLTITVSIASCERSFSKLKIILSYIYGLQCYKIVSVILLFLTLREKH